MQRLVLLALVGLIAQLIDGALGMAYGVTSSSLLLAAGIAPAVASASVHAAEVATTTVSGLAHWRFGNVDLRITLALAFPGAVGAFLGAAFLTSLPGDMVRPFVAVFLFGLGLYILWRFLRGQRTPTHPPTSAPRHGWMIPLGFIAGFCDASGGGGWGPIATSTLLARKDALPRKVVGSVDTSESIVALAATLGFVLTRGWEAVQLQWVVALLLGGVVAAPVAAWLVGRIPPHLLGVLVAGVILLTNARTLIHTIPVSPAIVLITYLLIGLVWAYALIQAVTRHRVAGAGLQHASD